MNFLSSSYANFPFPKKYQQKLWIEMFIMAKYTKDIKSCQSSFRQIISNTNWKYIKNAFEQESCSKNVVKIATCSQFHQHWVSSFFDDILLPKNYKSKL